MLKNTTYHAITKKEQNASQAEEVHEDQAIETQTSSSENQETQTSSSDNQETQTVQEQATQMIVTENDPNSQNLEVEMTETPHLNEEEQKQEDITTFQSLFKEADTRKAFFQLLGIEDTMESRKNLVDHAKEKSEKVYEIDNDKVLQLVIKIFVVMCRFAKKGKEYAHNFNSNGNESYNNVITVFAPKRLDLQRHYRMKCNQAVLRYNFGNDDWKLEVLHFLGFDVGQNQVKRFEKTLAKDNYHKTRKQKVATKTKRNQSKRRRREVSLNNSKLNAKAKYKSKKQKKLGETFETQSPIEKKKRKTACCKSCGFPIKGGEHAKTCPKYKEKDNQNQKKRKRDQDSITQSKKRKIEKENEKALKEMMGNPKHERTGLTIKIFGGRRNTIQKLAYLDAVSPEF